LVHPLDPAYYKRNKLSRPMNHHEENTRGYFLLKRGNTPLDLQLAEYFNFYNHEQRHESLDYELPANKYLQAA